VVSFDLDGTLVDTAGTGFHILRHLSDALDQVRRDEYKRLQGRDRSYIKGQRYTLLSNGENLAMGRPPGAQEAAGGQQASA
jgi:phosphoglycolate phosphatase-like HAD superfamily hydrolase